MDSYLVKPRIYMDRDGLTEILQGRKKAFIVTDRFMHENGCGSYHLFRDQAGSGYCNCNKRNLYDGRHKTGCAVCFGRRIFH